MKKIKQASCMAAVIISGILISTACLTGCAGKGAAPVSRASFLLDTYVTITIYQMERGRDRDSEQVLDETLRLCRDYEQRLSRTIETSEISRLNHRRTGERSVEVSEETRQVIEKGLEYGRLSGGAFDITIEPVSRLWDFSGADPHVPKSASLAEAVKQVDFQSVRTEAGRVDFDREDTAIDLGGIAKGFIADRLKEYMQAQGVTSGIINLGGNVLCVGSQPDGTPFSIGIQEPFGDQNQAALVLEISDLSVVTSGTYERCFTQDGRSYHHLLSPATGYPYENGLVQVSVVSEKSVDGDGLSTACFGLGLERGMELLDSMEDIWGIFMTEDGSIYYSQGAQALVRTEQEAR